MDAGVRESVHQFLSSKRLDRQIYLDRVDWSGRRADVRNFRDGQVLVTVLPLVLDETIRQVVVVEIVAVPAVVRDIPARFGRADDGRFKSERFRPQTPLL